MDADNRTPEEIEQQSWRGKYTDLRDRIIEAHDNATSGEQFLSTISRLRDDMMGELTEEVCAVINESSRRAWERERGLQFPPAQATNSPPYNNPDGDWGRWTVDCLPEYWGMESTQLTQAMLWALRPSEVRYSWGSVTTDSRLWRVTVYLERDPHGVARIKKIDQEVEMKLPEELEHAAALHKAIVEQEQRHLEQGGEREE